LADVSRRADDHGDKWVRLTPWLALPVPGTNLHIIPASQAREREKNFRLHTATNIDYDMCMC